MVKGSKTKRLGRSNAKNTSQEVKDENRRKTASRARTLVRRIANANPQLNKFLTLTFAKNVTNIKYSRYEFDKFLKRLKTRFKNFQYICVIEFQERGAIHFHLLCNLPYVDIDELAEIWKHGYVKINRIDNVDNVGAYITKYMTKDGIDSRLIGKKCYTMSKGLKQPKEYTEEQDIERILNNLENVKRCHTTEYETEYYGVVRYTQVVCDTPPKLPRMRTLQKLRIRWLYGQNSTDVEFPCNPAQEENPF